MKAINPKVFDAISIATFLALMSLFTSCSMIKKWDNQQPHGVCQVESIGGQWNRYRCSVKEGKKTCYDVCKNFWPAKTRGI